MIGAKLDGGGENDGERAEEDAHGWQPDHTPITSGCVRIGKWRHFFRVKDASGGVMLALHVEVDASRCEDCQKRQLKPPSPRPQIAP